MAKYITYRFKSFNGTDYDTYHLESRSSMILRFNSDGAQLTGNKATVESSLAALETTVAGIVSTGGQANVIEGVTANGTACTITSKIAKIPQATDSAWGVVKVDTALNASSVNPVQNKAINTALGLKADKSSLNDYILASEKGANSGVATLGTDGKVPSAQLPSYVDDVLEYDTLASFPKTGEAGKIYIAKDTNLTYRWSGTQYVEISASLALGVTSSTAYYGDKGKVAYDHSQSAHARTDATATAASTTNGKIKIDGSDVTVYTHPGYTSKSSGLYKITVDALGHVSATAAVAKADLTGIIGNFGAASASAAGSTGLVPAPAKGDQSKFLRADGTWVVPTDTNTDTKNTAGSTNDAAKLFLVGAKSQAANPQTFSNSSVYATAGRIYSNNRMVIDVQTGDTQPTNQAVGDLWFETVS